MNPIKLLVLLFLIQSCTGQNEKINGVSFVASRDEVSQENVNPVVELNANYAAVMPFGFIRELKNPEIVYNMDRQWFGETRAGAKQYILELQKRDIKVMLKPQIWIWRGEFTGYLKMDSEEDWKRLEASYEGFIMEFANLATELNVELFCIGTELEQFIINRPDYWNSLILKIKEVYKGKLTYAANWDEYKRVSFWDQMDFIGVDAYFPVSEEQTPSIEKARDGWKKWKAEMKGVSEKNNKKVLFTEFGYRSVDYAGKEPWKSDRSMNSLNLDAQTNAMKALFEEMWREDWMAGGFVWKWFIHHDRAGGVENNRFTPQNKPVEDVIRTYYKTIK